MTTLVGRPAPSSSPLSAPCGIVPDGNGGFFVADESKNQILRVYRSGQVTVFAGSGTRGGANGAAGLAQFASPCGLTLGPNNELYVADAGIHRIRKVDAMGNVTTFAGTSQGLVEGPKASAKFNFPTDIVYDGISAFYVADRYNSRIRKITLAGQVSTLAGSTAGHKDDPMGSNVQFYTPISLAWDGQGSLYVGDYGGYRIRKVAIVSGATTTFAGSGKNGILDALGTNAQFSSISGVYWSSSYLYVADSTTIRRIELSTKRVSTWAGSIRGYMDGAMGDALFYAPRRFLLQQEAPYWGLYVTEQGNRAIRKLIFQ